MASLANVTIEILDHNEYNPMFSSSVYSVVLNSPENYQLNDGITKLNAIDMDASDRQLTYFVAGAHQNRFYVDSFGNVRLLQQFNLNKDSEFMYNLTIGVSDAGGLKNYTSLVVYLNVTSSINLKQSPSFECALMGTKSELSPFDRKSLFPPLYILVTIEKS